jgi:hypothetical protein
MLVKFLVLVQLVCVGMYKWRPYWFLSWYSKYVTYINVTFSLRKLHSCRFSPHYCIWKKYRWGGTYLIQVGKYLNFPTEKRKEYFWLNGEKKKQLHMFEFAIANFYTENHSAPPPFFLVCPMCTSINI